MNRAAYFVVNGTLHRLGLVLAALALATVPALAEAGSAATVTDAAPLSLEPSSGGPPPPEAPATTRNLLGLEAAPLDEPLVTDRPDFTESTLTVPFGHAQLEAGYTFTSDDEDGRRVSDQTFPEFLLRVGLVKDVELRLGWIGWSLTEEMFHETNDAGRRVFQKEHDDGGTDLNVGFKFHLFEQRGWRPDFGVIAAMNLPTGAQSKTSGDVDPEVKWLWSYDLTDRAALSGNVNMAIPHDDGRHFFQAASSVSLGYALTDVVGAYVEYFGFYPNARGADCAHSLNGGMTFLITDNLQFDIRSGFGLNEEADDFFAGAGFAVRF